MVGLPDSNSAISNRVSGYVSCVSWLSYNVGCILNDVQDLGTLAQLREVNILGNFYNFIVCILFFDL